MASFKTVDEALDFIKDNFYYISNEREIVSNHITTLPNGIVVLIEL